MKYKLFILIDLYFFGDANDNIWIHVQHCTKYIYYFTFAFEVGCILFVDGLHA